MQHHPIASITRTTAFMACVAALMLPLAGSAAAAPAPAPQLSEHSGDTAQPVVTNPRVGDTPSDRVSPTAVPTTQSSTTSSDDDNAPLIIGISVLTVALLGSGMYVLRRRRHLAPGH